MHTRPIPSTGALLPVVGCGTWLGFDVGGRPQEMPQRGAVLAELFDAGGSVVDSSPMYGSAEQVVGDLLQVAGTRNRAFVATKVWTSGQRAGIDQMERSMALLLPLAAERGIAVMINLPFGGGKVPKALRQPPLPGWAQEIGCASWNQLLLKFVLSQPAVTCVIPGTSRPEHMRDNAAAGSGEMPGPAYWQEKLTGLGL